MTSKAVGCGDLLHGAIYALQNAFRLLLDAKLLNKNKRVASAFALATFAREELGRMSILVEQFRRLEPSGLIEIDALKQLCDDHVTKLRRGQLVSTVPKSAAAITEIEQPSRGSSTDPDLLKRQFESLQNLAKIKRRRDPNDVHERRLRALYVDVLSDGSWSNPSDITADEASQLVHMVSGEYANWVLMFRSDTSIREACARHGAPFDWAALSSSMEAVMLHEHATPNPALQGTRRKRRAPERER